MKIYSISASSDYFGLHQKAVNPDPSSPLLWFNDKKSVAKNWVPVEVEIEWYNFYDKKKKKRLPPADFPSHSLGSIIMSKHATETLKDYLEAYGELLPLKCDEAEFWVLNVLKEVDALDKDKSSPLYESYETKPPCLPVGKQIGIATPYAFFTEHLEDVDLFRVPELRGFFVTENFVKKVELLGMTGLEVRCEFDSVANQYGFDYLGRPLTTQKTPRSKRTK